MNPLEESRTANRAFWISLGLAAAVLTGVPLTDSTAEQLGTRPAPANPAITVTLVVEHSTSIERNAAERSLGLATARFAEKLDEAPAELNLVTFSTNATHHGAVSGERSLALAMEGTPRQGDANFAAALAAAGDGTEAPAAVVLFTDGRPTAFSDRFAVEHALGGEFEGTLAAHLAGPALRGLFRGDTGEKVTGFDTDGRPELGSNRSLASTGALPTGFGGSAPGSRSLSGDRVRSIAAARTLESARALREAGTRIFIVALGKPGRPESGTALDADLLAKIANRGGIDEAAAPRGAVVYAPEADRLDDAFALVAKKILTL